MARRLYYPKEVLEKAIREGNPEPRKQNRVLDKRVTSTTPDTKTPEPKLPEPKPKQS